MRNKEKTKRKLIDAVGDIIKYHGFDGLGVNKVANAAGVSKILIYRYFGGFSQLVRACVFDADFWSQYMAEEDYFPEDPAAIKDWIYKVLKEQAGSFYNHCEMGAILVSEISEGNPAVKNIVREENVPNRQTRCDVVSALLLAGTDHLIFEGQNAGNNDEPEIATVKKNKLMQSIGQIVEWTFG